MPLKRHYSHDDRTRRAAGVVLAVVGGLLLALLARLALDAISAALALLIVPPLLLIGIGVRLFRRVAAAIDVDLEQRRYFLVRDGKPAGGGALDELGPIRVSRDETTIRSSDPETADRTVVRYNVKPAGFGFISLYSAKSPRQARRKMEALARGWRLSCRSLDGPIRSYEHLDAPLHVRMRGDAGARTPAVLDPRWRVTVAPVFRGHTIVSHHRSFDPLLAGGAYAVIPVLLFVYTGGNPLALIHEMLADTLGQVLLALGGVLAGVVLWKVAQALLDTFRPGAIQVDDRGVAYRWSRLEFAQIEEVTAGRRIEVHGDRRVLAIPASFCPSSAVKPVAHELQRLILEAAARQGAR